MDVTYYTDPLCSWSWAFEPIWVRLRFELGAQLTWRYRMGGMIPDWRHYADPLNDVSLPSHVGPQWLEVSRLSGMPIEPWIWHEDPPASSYPACLAVKAAGLQGEVAGDRYLRRAREAVMIERRNIARRSVLLELAAEVVLDVACFERALDGGEATEAFREDLRDTKYREVGRFPTLIIRGPHGRGAALVGYRPFDVLWEAVSAVGGPALARRRERPEPDEYVAHWAWLTSRLAEREIAEACDANAGATAGDDSAESDPLRVSGAGPPTR